MVIISHERENIQLRLALRQITDQTVAKYKCTVYI